MGGVKNCNVVLAGCIGGGWGWFIYLDFTLGLPVIFCVNLERKKFKFGALRLSEFSRHYVMHVGWYCFI